MTPTIDRPGASFWLVRLVSVAPLVHRWRCARCGWEGEVEQSPAAPVQTWWDAVKDAHPAAECG